MRGRVGAVIGAIGVVLLATGCSSAIPGVARQAAYRSLPLDSLTARMAHPVKGAMAYSLDGSLSLVWDGGQHAACIKPAGACFALPKDAAPGTASFSPDGRHVVVTEDFARDYWGRLWIGSVPDGTSTEVRAPSGCRSATARPSATPTSRAGAASQAMYQDAIWLDAETFVALDVSSAAGSCLVRVSTDHPQPEPIAGAPADDAAYPPLATGGGVVVVGLAIPQEGNNSLLVVDLKAGTTRTITVDPAAVHLARIDAVAPLAVSPDGSTVLLKLTDTANFRFVQLAALTLASSSMTVFHGWGETSSGASKLDDAQATFSPDGRQVIALAFQSAHISVLLAGPASGGTVRQIGRYPAAAPPLGRMTWTGTNLLVPGSVTPGPLGAAPWQLSG